MTAPRDPDVVLPARYTDLQYVASGAFGEVYRARLVDGRDAAVKVLSAEAATSPAAAWAFQAEHGRLARLEHPAFPAALEAGRTGDGRPYHAMTYIEGRPLDELAPLSPVAARAVVVALAEALGHLHAQGWVHGDLKPENVLRDAAGEIHVLDVGQAARIGALRDGVQGTLEYMAPEVLRLAPADPRADWYALGALAFHLLAGRPPFQAAAASASGPADLVRAQLFETPPALPPEVSAADPGLAGLVARLLGKDPARRPGTAAAVLAALGGADAEQGEALPLAPAAYVGRADVVSAWQARLAGVAAEPLGLAGGPGMGKTRALEECRLAAQLAGRAWLGASCAGDADAPGGALRAIVRQASGPTVADPVLAAWLAGEVPPGHAELDPKARQLAVRRAAADALAAAARSGGGLAIGLDQWEAATPGTRDFVAYLARNVDASRVAWALAELGEGAPAGGLELRPLPDADAVALVRSRLGGEPPATLLADVLPAGQGSPLLLALLVQDAWERGALCGGPGGWTYAPVPTGGGAPTLARLGRARLDALPAVAAGLARAAAVAAAAGALAVPVLGQAAGLSDAELAEAAEGLVARGLAREAGGRLRLTFPGLADALRAELPQAARAELAGRLAVGLLTAGRAGPPGEAPGASRHGGPGGLSDEAADEASLATLPLERLGPAAWLALDAGQAALAGRVAAAAGRRALRAGDVAAALRYLDAASAHLPPDVSPDTARSLWLDRADAFRLLDRLDEAAADYGAVLGAPPGAPPPVADVEARAAIGLAKVRQMKGDYDEAIALATRGEAAAHAAGDGALAARAALAAALLHLFRGDQGAALASGRRASEGARTAGAEALLGQALNQFGMLLVQHRPAACEDGLAMLAEALDIARRVGDRLGEAFAWQSIGNARLSLGDLRAAGEAFGQFAAICHEAAFDVERLFADLNRAIVAGDLGEAESSEALALDVAARAAAAGRKFPLAAARAVAAQAAWRAGRPGRDAEALDDALGTALAIQNKYLEEHVRLHRIQAALAAGARAGARLEVTLAAPLVGALGHAEGQERFALAEGELALLDGDAAAAAAAAARLVDAPNRVVAYMARVLAARAALATCDAAVAVVAVSQAEAIAAAWDAPWHLAATGLLRARALAAAGDGAGAAAWSRDLFAGAATAAGDVGAGEAGPARPLAGGNVYAAAGAAALLAEADPAAGASAWAAVVAAYPAAAAVLVDPASAALRQAWDLNLPPAWSVAARHATTGLAADPVLLLARLTEGVAVAGDEAALGALGLRTAMDLARAERGYVLIYDDGRLAQVITEGLDYHAEAEAGFSTSMVERVMLTGEPLYVVDAAADSAWKEAASVMALGLRTVVALPLAVGARMYGVMYMDREAVEPALGAADLALLEAIAAVTAGAFGRERARRGAERTARGWELAAALAAEAAPHAPREAIARRALAGAARELGAARGYWLRRGPGDGSPWAAVAGVDVAGAPIAYEPGEVSEGIAGWVVAHREPLAVLDTSAAEGWRERASVAALGVRTVWAVPAGAGAWYFDAPRAVELDQAAALAAVAALAAFTVSVLEP